MQAVRVAEELGIASVLVPPHAGVLSAFGLLASDFVHYETRTHRLRVDEATMAEFKRVLHTLAESVGRYLERLGLGTKPALSYALQMRYAHQAFEIPVELNHDELESLDAASLMQRFHSAHQRIFEFSADHACDIVSFRVGGAVSPASVPVLSQPAGSDQAPESITLFDQGHSLICECLARGTLANAVSGPALIEDGTSTIYVAPGWSAQPDAHANLVISR